MPTFSIVSFNSCRLLERGALIFTVFAKHCIHATFYMGFQLAPKEQSKTFSWPEHQAVHNGTYHSHTWNGEEEGSDDDDEGQHLPCPFVPEHPVELVPETRQRRL